MKTLVRILSIMTCILVVIACAKINNDPVAAPQTLKKVNANGTGTDAYKYLVEEFVSLPVFCDDGNEPIDFVTASPSYIIKVKDHYKKQEYLWTFLMVNNIEYISDNTKEVFKVHGEVERYYSADGMDYFHYNMIGNMGSHYIVNIKTDMVTWESTIRSNCH